MDRRFRWKHRKSSRFLVAVSLALVSQVAQGQSDQPPDQPEVPSPGLPVSADSPGELPNSVVDSPLYGDQPPNAFDAGPGSEDSDLDDSDGDEDDAELDALLDQDLSTLRNTSVTPSLDIEVTSVERQASTIGRTPSAVFVITQEMIQRSGARSIPDVLRLAPGLHVAHIDGNKWSITSRGFGYRFANKLLVQIDGRTVYTPLFAGVYWDMQSLLLDDIERIEVIRGPGATVWGANAVNGVINIITKSAADTHGVYAMAGGGTVEQGFAGARIGGQTASGVDWRASGQWYDRDDFFEPRGLAYDGSHLAQVNLRADWQPDDLDAYTLQAGYSDGNSGYTSVRPFIGLTQGSADLAGTNVLGRWTRTFSDDAAWSLQTYYDRTDRFELGFDQVINTYDIDFQDRLAWNSRNVLVWGTGYRRIWDDLTNDSAVKLVSADPEQRTVEWYSAFVQNQYAISEDFAYLTLGTKLSHDTFAEFQVQPSAKFLILPTDDSAAWLSVSRAVRTPNRATRDLRILVGEVPPPAPPGLPLFFVGSPLAPTEKLIAYEAGYRRQPNEWFSYDIATFINDYDDLESSRVFISPLGLPYVGSYAGGNAISYGTELFSQVNMTTDWRLSGAYSLIRIDVDLDAASIDDPAEMEGRVPFHQSYLMSSWDFAGGRQFDLIGRYNDNVPAENIPSYLVMDVRASWRPTRHVELTAVGRNLLDSAHPEYGTNVYTGDVATEVPRSVYGMMQVRY